MARRAYPLVPIMPAPASLADPPQPMLSPATADAVAALRESEERLRLALASADMGTWHWDARTNQDTRDASLNRILGLAAEESSQPLEDFIERIVPDDRALVVAAIERALQQHTDYDAEFRIMRPDGTIRWLRDRGKLICHPDGSPAYMTGAVIDVTSRKQAENAHQFLTEASVLLSGSLDYTTTLHTVAHLIVPRLADWCIIDMLADDGSIQTLVVAHSDPARESIGWDMVRRYPINPEAPGGTAYVLRTGQPELVPEISDSFLEAVAADAEHLRLLRTLGITSSICVPLIARGRTLGTIALVTAESRRRFDVDDVPLVEDLARRAALAVDNARLHQETQQHARRSQALAMASHLFAEANLDLQEVLDRFTRVVAELIGDFCSLRLIADDGPWLVTMGVYHPDPAARPLVEAVNALPYRVDEGFMGQVIQSGQTLRIPELSPEEVRAMIKPVLWPYLEQVGLYSVLMAPLRVRGQIIGAVGATRSTPGRPYTADDEVFLQDLADRAALAIDHARLYAAERRAKEQAERAVDRTTRLQQITAALSASRSPDQVAQVVLHQGIAALGAYAGMIMLRTTDGAAYELLDATGYASELWEAWEYLPIDAPLPLADAGRTGQPIWIPSRAVYAECYPHLMTMLTDRTAALAAIPLETDANPIGVLGLSFASDQSFTADDQTFMLALAHQCAQAIERARLYEAEQQARSEAEAAVRVRDQFLSIAAHELKTPLTVLLGNVQLIQRRSMETGTFGERDHRALALIETQVLRLNGLINALLDISRIQSGQLSIQPVPLDLGALAERVVAEVQPTLGPQHALSCEREAEPLLVNGDAVRLEQVLHNLIANAIKYSPHGGQVSVRVERCNDKVCLLVRDEGIGIPKSALPHLFQRFFRAANADLHHITGLGVGLYVVKKIVSLHGGSVTVTSTEGGGSVFTVALPSRWIAPPPIF
ncbi:MAG TPA: GAF domain-containing protein [Herpetosiphonaceae bacterium]